jgi:hypothetical protein
MKTQNNFPIETARFDEVEIGDIIEVDFSTGSSPNNITKREGLVKKIAYDSSLFSDTIIYGGYVVARTRKNNVSAINIITRIIKKEEHPEYFL